MHRMVSTCPDHRETAIAEELIARDIELANG